MTSSAGYPLDKTYYQTVKGMVTPIDILSPGGTLIIASECSEGFGSEEFRPAQAKLVELGADAVPWHADGQVTGGDRRVADRDAVEADAAGSRAAFHQGLDPEEREDHRSRDCSFDRPGDRRERRRHDDMAVAVIPEGPYVVPVDAKPLSDDDHSSRRRGRHCRRHVCRRDVGRSAGIAVKGARRRGRGVSGWARALHVFRRRPAEACVRFASD